MSQDYKYRLDALYDELGIGTDKPFRVEDKRTMPYMVERYYDILLDETTVFRANENGDLYYRTTRNEWVPAAFCFCRLLSFCDYDTKLVPVETEEE